MGAKSVEPAGDAFVRELDFSRVTLRLRHKEDKKGDADNEDQTIAKLQGNTLDVLQRCLVGLCLFNYDSAFTNGVSRQYKDTELVLKSSDGTTSRVTVNMKYIPVKMDLDQSESMNNMGTLRVDILDAADLPAADRNGFSDPYCKFNLNGKDMYKTKVQKKTLHPAWNEFFECSVKSRTAAKFKVTVMDWDMGDKDDLLGEAAINLNLLEPFKAQDIVLNLDGKSGALRLKMVFKPDYVTRSRQGSSTFSGTFATPGKIVGAPVKGVGKVGGAVGGGVVKGASFLRHGFKSRKDSRDVSNGNVEIPEDPTMNGDSAMATPQRAAPMFDASPAAPQTPTLKRTSSFGAASSIVGAGGAPGKAEAGTAMFLILSASGYPSASKLQVHVKQIGSKGAKEVHKTKGIKSSSGQAEWDAEMFKVTCSPDTQFQVLVEDDKLLGGHKLGEALFFIDDSPAGGEKAVKVGEGNVVIKTTFMPADDAMAESPRSRRSFLSKRSRDVSGAKTPMSS